ncbi:hypothetical protein L249_6360 [Ophiocordyceps polyrhachis-furcata BCC 54312]|uniref:Uncharacterized protein n=1 Tax=Ophiocordyceps polyrhachis-furcata BCC 54312 TaxID=1330021 RepID=A0A367L192_9HYPO|nr:hypothetical protein L249_6360 [Ophiocordyceps polyrhachis-furcata BCC 54312]
MFLVDNGEDNKDDKDDEDDCAFYPDEKAAGGYGLDDSNADYAN